MGTVMSEPQQPETPTQVLRSIGTLGQGLGENSKREGASFL